MIAATDLVLLDAFYLEHAYCGELESDVEDASVRMTCSCGAVINRTLEPGQYTCRA